MGKILVVDDSMAASGLVKLFIQRFDYDCDCTDNGEKAFEMFLSNHYEMVITDHWMPGMTGVELIRKIRHSNSHGMFIPIIVVSSDTTPERKEEYKQVGATGILPKPVNADDIQNMIKRLLRDR